MYIECIVKSIIHTRTQAHTHIHAHTHAHTHTHTHTYTQVTIFYPLSISQTGDTEPTKLDNTHQRALPYTLSFDKAVTRGKQ